MSLAAIVLAAGAGKRFGGGKMSAPFRREPLIRHAIRAARAAPVARVIVACPADLDIGEWRDAGPAVEMLPIVSGALSDSLKAGVAAGSDSEGLFVFLGDMPLVPAGVAHELAALLRDRYAALPRHRGLPGHPVLFAPRAFPDLLRLEGDRGAGSLLRGRKDVAFLDWPDEGVLLDVDRAEDIARLEASGRE